MRNFLKILMVGVLVFLATSESPSPYDDPESFESMVERWSDTA